MADHSATDDELRPEYNESVFSGAVRGKYAKKYQAGTNLVRLHPDVVESFPNEQAVNNALRFLKQLAQDASRLSGTTLDHGK